MSKATLHIIHGFLGAGKTTFSRKLSIEQNAEHLNPDEWCMKLFSKEDYEQHWEKRFDETLNILWQKAIEHLMNGTDVVFDMGFWDRASRDHAKAIAKKCDSDFKHYYIYAPDDVLKKRLLERSGKIAENNLQRFDEIKKHFFPPETDENAIIINNW